MSTTPRTDEAAAILNRQSDYGLSGYVTADFARQLETELQEAKDQLAIWQPQVAEAIRQVAASDELYRDMCRKIANQQENMDVMVERINALRDALLECRKDAALIQETRWGNDGDCGVLPIAARITDLVDEVLKHP